MSAPFDYVTDVTQNLDDESVEAIRGLLRSHNQTANPQLWAKFDAGTSEPQPLQIALRTEANRTVAGLLASTCMSWLKIEIMAVHAEHRRQGIGAKMLQAAEAVRRGCLYSFVDTMDYQAPGFYQRCGYETIGTIIDWDSHGHTKFFLSRSLRAI